MMRLLRLIVWSVAALLAVPVVLVGLFLLLALGGVAVSGLFIGSWFLLFAHFLPAAKCLGVGTVAFIVIVLIWDRIFAARDVVRGRIYAGDPR